MSIPIFNPNRILVVIPSYNEGDRVARVVKEVQDAGFRKIVLVDDGSDDESISLPPGSGVVLLTHPVNRGAGAATETGLQYCRGQEAFDAVVTIDADTQHDPADIVHLLTAHFEQQADITVGNRFMNKQNHIPGPVRFFNKIANLTTMMLSGSAVSDSQSGFKVLSKKTVEQIRFEHDNYEYCSELFVKARKLGLRIIEIPVKVYYPEEIRGKGQKLFRGIRTFFNLVYSTLFKQH